MKRKNYYRILAISIPAILVYALLSMFVFRADMNRMVKFYFHRLEDAVALFILVFESYSAQNNTMRINSVLIPLFLIGIAAASLRVPLTMYVFIVTCFAAVIFLFIEVLSKKSDKLLLFLLASIVMSRFLGIVCAVLHWPAQSLFFLSSLLLMTISFFLLLTRIFKKEVPQPRYVSSES